MPEVDIVARLIDQVSANARQITQAVEQLRGSTGNLGRQGSSNFRDLADSASSACNDIIGAVRNVAGSFGIYLGARELINLTQRFAENTFQTKQFADQVGLSVEELHGLNYAAEATGIGTGRLQMGLQFLSRTLGQMQVGMETPAASFLGRIGDAQTIYRLRNATSEMEAFGIAMDEVSKLYAISPQLAAQFASSLFGGRWSGPMLARMKDYQKFMGEEAEWMNLQPGMQDRATRASIEWWMATLRLQTAWEGLQTTVLTDVLEAVTPAITRLAEEMRKTENRQLISDIAVSQTDKMIADVKEMYSSITTAIEEWERMKKEIGENPPDVSWVTSLAPYFALTLPGAIATSIAKHLDLNNALANTNVPLTLATFFTDTVPSAISSTISKAGELQTAFDNFTLPGSILTTLQKWYDMLASIWAKLNAAIEKNVTLSPPGSEKPRGVYVAPNAPAGGGLPEGKSTWDIMGAATIAATKRALLSGVPGYNILREAIRPAYGAEPISALGPYGPILSKDQSRLSPEAQELVTGVGHPSGGLPLLIAAARARQLVEQVMKNQVKPSEAFPEIFPHEPGAPRSFKDLMHKASYATELPKQGLGWFGEGWDFAKQLYDWWQKKQRQTGWQWGPGDELLDAWMPSMSGTGINIGLGELGLGAPFAGPGGLAGFIKHGGAGVLPPELTQSYLARSGAAPTGVPGITFSAPMGAPTAGVSSELMASLLANTANLVGMGPGFSAGATNVPTTVPGITFMVQGANAVFRAPPPVINCAVTVNVSEPDAAPQKTAAEVAEAITNNLYASMYDGAGSEVA